MSLVPSERKGLMTVKELEREQEKRLPKEDLSPYAGQWVAIRGGYVVASDSDPIALRDKPEVQKGDLLMLAPPAGPGIFIL